MSPCLGNGDHSFLPFQPGLIVSGFSKVPLFGVPVDLTHVGSTAPMALLM
ncbi:MULTISPECIES: hypothetical protein [unclassified Bradyrhizobium]